MKSNITRSPGEENITCTEEVALAALQDIPDHVVVENVSKMMIRRGFSIFKKSVGMSGGEAVDIWTKDGLCAVVILGIKASIQNSDVETIRNSLRSLQMPYPLDYVVKLYRKSISFYVKNCAGSQRPKFQFLHTNLFLCDILGHQLQPHFAKIPKTHVHRAENLHKYEMPRISTEDPVCKLLDFSAGDIALVCENSGCTHETLDKCWDSARFRKVVKL